MLSKMSFASRGLLACLLLIGGPAALGAEGVAEYLADLKQYPLTESTVTQFLKGIDAEKKASDAAAEGLANGQSDVGSIGSLMKCMSAGNMIKMGECGGEMAGEKSPQEKASGLDDGVFEGMKQRLWIYFDGTAAERKAQFSAAELAVLDKRRAALEKFRGRYLSPHPDEGA